MGIFSRGKRADSEAAVGAATDVERETLPNASATDAAPTAPSVGISVSTFRGVGAAGAGVGTSAAEAASASAPPAASEATAVGGKETAPPTATTRVRPPAEAPPAQETVPGLRDNALLRAALANLPETPAPEQILDVARQLLQGHVFLRVKGDARSLLAEGKNLPLMVATQGDQQYVMVFSSGAALQASVRADGDSATSAMGQPVTAVLRHVLAGSYAGIVLDHSSTPARLVLPRDLLEKAMKDTTPDLTLKSLLAGPRTAATASEVVQALGDAPLWIAANRTPDGQVGIAEARSAEGTRFLEVFSHPLEVFALGRRDQAVPMKVSQLATALSGDPGLSGMLLDPAGPWIQLSRSDLAPILALAG